MARFLKSKKETIGLSPDELRFSGEKKIDNARLRCINYNADDISETELKSVSEVLEFYNPKTTTWLNIDGLHDTEILQQISTLFDIEGIIMASVLETYSRPKIHEYDNCIYLSAKMLQFDEKNDKITAENLSLIFKNNLLISFQERVGDVFNPVRERLRNNKKRLRGSGSDYLTFALLDIVIDNYIHIISRLGDKIEELDSELIINPSTKSLEKINKYKGEINYLSKIINPCREMILNFAKLDSEFIDDEMESFLHELQNNILLAHESVYNYREILSDQLNIFHTTVSYKLNDVLKFLTIFSVIFIPITFIAGVYGTNFDNIPELHYKYGYFIMWAVIIIIVLLMIAYFKRKKWL